MATAKPNINDQWAETGSKTDPGSVKTLLGWIAEIPTFEVMNWVFNRSDTFLAHLNERGIGEWDAVTAYETDAVVLGSDGVLYRANTGSTNKNPTTESEWDDLTSSMLLEVGIDPDIVDALTGAASPAAGNVFATMNDLAGVPTKGLDVDNLMYIEDQQPSGTAGGGSTAATQNVRVLNTKVVDNIAGASLAANQITLPAGTYWVEFDAPAIAGAPGTMEHKTRLRNTSDASTAVVGSSERTQANTNDDSMTRSHGSGLFTIGASKVFELQHYTSQTHATDGLGMPVTSGEIEVYARIKIWKVA
jgi:hypothetical protein